MKVFSQGDQSVRTEVEAEYLVMRFRFELSSGTCVCLDCLTFSHPVISNPKLLLRYEKGFICELLF